MDGKLNDLKADELNTLLEQVGDIIRTENAQGDEEDIEYSIDDDGIFYLRYNYKGSLFEITEKEKDTILKKLDIIAENYGQYDKTNVVKIIRDDDGNEIKNVVQKGQLTPLTQEEMLRICKEESISISEGEDII